MTTHALRVLALLVLAFLTALLPSEVPKASPNPSKVEFESDTCTEGDLPELLIEKHSDRERANQGVIRTLQSLEEHYRREIERGRPEIELTELECIELEKKIDLLKAARFPGRENQLRKELDQLRKKLEKLKPPFPAKEYEPPWIY